MSDHSPSALALIHSSQTVGGMVTVRSAYLAAAAHWAQSLSVATWRAAASAVLAFLVGAATCAGRATSGGRQDGPWNVFPSNQCRGSGGGACLGQGAAPGERTDPRLWVKCMHCMRTGTGGVLWVMLLSLKKMYRGDTRNLKFMKPSRKKKT